MFALVGGQRRLSLRAEVMFTRRRHTVDLAPVEPLQLTFKRDSLDIAALGRMKFHARGERQVYAVVGPVIGIRVGEDAKTSDPSLRRGNPETDIYAVQALAYSAPELLRKSYLSAAGGVGFSYRRFAVEVRLTEGLQSIFKDREGVVRGLTSVGGHEPTIRSLIPQFSPFLESAKNRDVAVLFGVHF